MKFLSLMLCLAIACLGSCSPRQSENKVLGVSFATLAEERWSREKELISAEAEKHSLEVIFQSAGGDAAVQNNQIENLITQGADVLLIIAQNCDAAVTAVEAAHQEGIPCIAYDRYIPAPSLALYVSFDSVKVGEIQASALVAAAPKGRYLWLGGSPTDDNAHLVRKGQMKILTPRVESGDIELVGEQWCNGWSPEEALKHTENALTANLNRIDAVVASNDGTAGAAVQALKAQGLAGQVPVSGQDAELAACQRIALGTQTVTVFKDVRLLVSEAVRAAEALALGKEPEGIKRRADSIKAILLEGIAVTRDNLDERIVKSGFHARKEVYRLVPESQWPRDE